MQRLTLILLLLLVAGCESSSSKKAYRDWYSGLLKPEQDRLHQIYRSSFEHGFLEAWDGHGGVIETEGLTGYSSDPEGEWAVHEGYMDGQKSGRNARLAFDLKQAEKEKQ